MKDFVALSKHHISSRFGCSFFKDGPFFFFLFVFSIVQLVHRNLPMSGFEPQISGVGRDCSTNWATTTAQVWVLLRQQFRNRKSYYRIMHLHFVSGLFNLHTTSDSRPSASELTEAANWFHIFVAFPLFSNWSVSILNWKGTVSFFLTTLFWLALAN